MLLTLLIAVLSFVVIAGVGFALAGGSGSADAKTLKRAQTLVGGGDAREARRRPVAAQDQRRKQILKTLRDQDRQQKKATLSLSARLQQAGLGIGVQTFWVISVIVGVLLFGDMPTVHMLVGAAIVIGSVLYMFHRERKRGVAPSVA